MNTTKRSESINIRFDPRLRYMAGIAARHERRTLSNLIESAVAVYLDGVSIASGKVNQPVMQMVQELWSTHEADRFIALAENLPFLLTFEEEELYELIQQSSAYQNGDRQVIRDRFTEWRNQAAVSAANKPTVSIGSYWFRDNRLTTSIPKELTADEQEG